MTRETIHQIKQDIVRVKGFNPVNNKISFCKCSDEFLYSRLIIQLVGSGLSQWCANHLPYKTLLMRWFQTCVVVLCIVFEFICLIGGTFDQQSLFHHEMMDVLLFQHTQLIIVNNFNTIISHQYLSQQLSLVRFYLMKLHAQYDCMILQKTIIHITYSHVYVYYVKLNEQWPINCNHNVSP